MKRLLFALSLGALANAKVADVVLLQAQKVAEDSTDSSPKFKACQGQPIGQRGSAICDTLPATECGSRYAPIGMPGEQQFMQCELVGDDCRAVGPECMFLTDMQVEYLVVAGGGGAGSGGGGAGGVLKGQTTLEVGGTLPVLVGAGGKFGGGGSPYWKANLIPTSGSDSKLGDIVAKGGGHGGGGSTRTQTPPVGGSGGGGGYDASSITRSSGTKGQGHGGGRCSASGYGGGGGGGGAGEAGKDSPQKHYGGKGGDGISSDITGTPVFYGGGGGGAVNDNTNQAVSGRGGQGGKGGGGHGSDFGNGASWWIFSGTDGEPNTGGGGGGTDADSRMAGNGGSGIVIVRYKADFPLLSGGKVTSAGGYQVHSFTTIGKDELQYTMKETLPIDFLVVAGGGGAGSGGGGGGGVLTGSKFITKGTFWDVKVGEGGAAGMGGARPATSGNAMKGGDSVLGDLVAIGGGKGADRTRTPGDGGSGGGGGWDKADDQPARGSPGQGFHGGLCAVKGWGGGGGGGGAGGPGEAATVKHKGGKGGDGVSSDITGTLKWYGGGGGGGASGMNNKPIENGGGAGGKGGGGKGSDFGIDHRSVTQKFTGTDGEANTGGGGGGTDPEGYVAGKGGSGIVVVRYKSSTPVLTGGTITTSGGYQIHTFTTGTSALKYD